MERRLTAILAADIVGYSRLMGADEAGTLAQLKEIRSELLDKKIAEHQGRIVKIMGDGILAEFPSVVGAVACAAEIQQGMQARNASMSADRRIEFRVGINLGDVIVEGDDIYGDGVNVAARLQTIAAPAGIAVTQSVRDQVGNRLNCAFEDCGDQQLKNIDKPVRVYNVLLEKAALTGMRSTNDPRPSVAVLPFTNMSGDPEQEYFIQDEITHAIVQQLKVKLLPQEKKSIAQLPTDNVEAYTYYLRGRDFLYRFSKRYFELARRMFVKAVELDPGSPTAIRGSTWFIKPMFHSRGFWKPQSRFSHWIITWPKPTLRAESRFRPHENSMKQMSSSNAH